MTSIPPGAVWRPYLNILGEASLDVAAVGAWIAAAELPPPRRRLARGGVLAVTAATAIPGFRAAARAAESPAAAPPPPTAGLPVVDAGIRLPVDEEAVRRATRRRVATLAAALTIVAAGSVGCTVAVRRLERRWLARLVRQGHPHPHRALGLRMAGLYAAAVVPARLLGLRQNPPAARRAD